MQSTILPELRTAALIGCDSQSNPIYEWAPVPPEQALMALASAGSRAGYSPAPL